MLFNSLTFFVLLGMVMSGLAVLRARRPQHLLLLVASYVFYGWWDWRFLSLILFSTVVAFAAGQMIGKQPHGSRARKRWLAAALCVDLGVLGFFKYANFFIDSAAPVLAQLGLNPGTLDIILPVGISFFTFQTMSYTIDVYREEIPVERSFLTWALFVAYFPQLVAGPILRARDFLPQLQHAIVLRRDNLIVGGQRVLIGLGRKVLIADRLALFVDPVFANPGLYSPVTLWLAVIAYAMQIYNDFAGYSDIAIGLGRMMGYDIMENFRLPYAATSVSDFWRRWHISLSTWLRDYLYVPLGGNRRGETRTYVNLTLVMLLGGLWHGAAWRFVAWGALHGLALAVDRALFRRRRPERQRGGVLASAGGWIVTMLVVLVGWVFFRASSFVIAMQYLEGMAFMRGGGVDWFFPPLVYFVIPLGLIVHLIGRLRYEARGLEPYYVAGRVTTPALYCGLLLALALLAPNNASPFLYFQF